MVMRPGLFTVEGLSVELARDRRTIARHLREVPPDGKLGDRAAWHIATAVRALRHAEPQNASTAKNEDLDALEDAAERTEELFDLLQKEPDIERRRELLHSGAGRVIGELVHAFEQCQRAAEPNFRVIAQPFVDQMVGGAVATVLHLCRWRIDFPS